MYTEIIDPVQYPAWDDLLLSHDGYSFFHSSYWARVLRESYGYTPLYFTTFRHGSVLTLIPLMEVKSPFTGSRGVSLPFTDYCDPIVPEGQDLRSVTDCLAAYGRKRGWKYIELRCRNNSNEQDISSSYYYGHVLTLSPDEEKMRSGLRDSTRRNIGKAEKSGVEVIIDRSAQALAEFTRLNCVTRRSHGIPPQPGRFFKSLYDHIIAKGHGCIARAVFQKKTIAGALYLHIGKKAVYKYGASDKAYQSLRANNLVMWKAITWYARNGFKSLCFGRSEPENSGLLQFKSGWGADEHCIRYYRYDLQKGEFMKRATHVKGLHNNIFNKMPVPLLRMAGSLLYKHIG